MSPGVFARIRAAAIAAVVAVHGVAALPVPHVVRPRELKDPVAAAELRRWSERLTAIGYPIETTELGDEVVRWSGRLGRAHRAVLRPFRPWFRFTGTGQGWALFANPDTHPSRMEISVVRGEEQALVYRRLDPQHDRYAARIAYRRVRGLYDATSARHRPTAGSRRFADWVAQLAQADDPTVDGVVVRFVATHHPLPGSGRRPRKSKVRYEVMSRGQR